MRRGHFLLLYAAMLVAASGNTAVQSVMPAIGRAMDIPDVVVAIAYTMLHTTALAFADTATAEFSRAGLTTYARLIQDLNHVIPQALLEDLKTDDHAPVVAPGVVDQARQTIDQVWKSTN